MQLYSVLTEAHQIFYLMQLPHQQTMHIGKTAIIDLVDIVEPVKSQSVS
jgi:hypothetical protein